MTQEQRNQQQYEQQQQLQQRFQHLQQNSPEYYQNPQPSQQQNPKVFHCDFQGSECQKRPKVGLFWGKVLSTYTDSTPFQRNEDMLTSKWSTLKANCQKFNALHKHAQRYIPPKWDAPEPVTIRTVNVEGTSGGNVELFGQDKRPHPSGARAAKKMKSESSSRTVGSQTRVFADALQTELRLKRESQQEKDRTMIKFEELC
ncbi:hypothetical protein Tco_0296719 [Tanacetum coccineum]